MMLLPCIKALIPSYSLVLSFCSLLSSSSLLGMAASAELKGRLETVEEIKSPANKYCAACKEKSTLMPTIYPNVF